jgi:imidazole glycerol-phosphate synthase subunit HisF
MCVRATGLLKKRLIARLDIKPPNLIKPMNLDGVRVVGDPHAYATRYNDEGIDELLYIDAVSSLYGRSSILGIVERAVADVFCPVTVGGGIRSLEDARAAFLAGADKIALNSAVVRRPELITELAHKYGSQAVVLQIDAKRKGNGWEAYTDGGREPSGKDAVAWAQEGVERGCGEILVTSIDAEGVRRGCDTLLIGNIASAVQVPVIASGGVGSCGHVVDAFRAGADAVAIAHALHYRTTTLGDIRMAVAEAGFPVRPVEQAA